jgi:hypothetical protein
VTELTRPTVREWARTNGIPIANRGRISPAIHRQYEAEFGDDLPARPQGSAQCTACKRIWIGLRECHCTRCHFHFSNVRHWDAHRATDNGTCLNPLSIRDRHGVAKYKIKDTRWGGVIVEAAERPDLDNDTD